MFVSVCTSLHQSCAALCRFVATESLTTWLCRVFLSSQSHTFTAIDRSWVDLLGARQIPNDLLDPFFQWKCKTCILWSLNAIMLCISILETHHFWCLASCDSTKSYLILNCFSPFHFMMTARAKWIEENSWRRDFNMFGRCYNGSERKPGQSLRIIFLHLGKMSID